MTRSSDGMGGDRREEGWCGLLEAEVSVSLEEDSVRRMTNRWGGEFSDWVGIDGFPIFDFLHKLSTGALT